MKAGLLAAALLLQDPSALLEQGRRYLEEGNLTAAERAFRDLAAESPGDPRASYFLGLTLARLDRIDEAIEALERARAAASRPNPSVLFELGTAYSKQERWKEAEEALRLAAELIPDSAAIRLQLGWVYYSSVQGERAREEFQKVLAAEPSPLAWLYLGLTEIGLGRNEAAIEALREALVLDPDLLEAHVALGKTLARSGRDEEAKPVLLRALEIDPGAAEPRFQLGLLALRGGDLSGARDAFERAIAADEAHLQAWYNLALVSERLGRRDEASSAWKRVEELRASGDYLPEASRRTRSRDP